MLLTKPNRRIMLPLSNDYSNKLNKTLNTKSFLSVFLPGLKLKWIFKKGELEMSNTELLTAKGRLAELNERFKELEMKAESLLIQIRELLNPLSEFLDIDLDRVLTLAKEFRLLQLNARECLTLIDKIKQTYNL